MYLLLGPLARNANGIQRSCRFLGELFELYGLLGSGKYVPQ